MTYEDYLPYSRTELLAKIAEQMSPKRFKHVLGVEKAALSLAERYGCDSNKASLAALLHDYAKECPDQVFLDLIDKYQLSPELAKWNNNVWHGMVGIYKIQEDLGLQDKEILRAIEIHTVGAAEMTLLDKVLYVADYIEEGRIFPLVDDARKIAQLDLDKAVAYETVNTVAYLASKAQPIFPQTLDTYNAFCSYLKEN
ncbi:bis(5'-nucleosyl)-tetraphosphatase (symmetrical) YqeK [Streptococcus dysgalactiae]|uniref:bis(5'-nucleosyl)-tetraphosphatase (symmetrical) n=1 Tax=Streptococcus dysgalactiae TaxID=1334 RepID=A0A9X9SIC3_STRDY|nr:bis(5'-nucleosyl)-tetraphosphatase (symmetrical) YqeK [Streptococcus dysgalactiae]QGH03669.1 HD domain-containing protein [Streptococcus dysgalactiae subsp. dysgalactiae]WAI93475.1 bis(5'-nucleosyl)-tetraphosphatase (symmetrical) YqeK [Streptococcus dysgalactiae]WCE85031.1 bis(5'-nucleosyl)-tetraphosphatase (symmetrical) YqeK [Streptococcus dysgalactiae]WCN25030.1 bis(5'-nucleosyl)-tetraphosphatase (symmetrical) YqeK [Streptococcus dysgalactiae]VTS21992.1 HAD superfamily hydrolase [Streptoc